MSLLPHSATRVLDIHPSKILDISYLIDMNTTILAFFPLYCVDSVYTTEACATLGQMHPRDPNRQQ